MICLLYHQLFHLHHSIRHYNDIIHYIDLFLKHIFFATTSCHSSVDDVKTETTPTLHHYTDVMSTLTSVQWAAGTVSVTTLALLHHVQADRQIFSQIYEFSMSPY